jgi:hypothetical protein
MTAAILQQAFVSAPKPSDGVARKISITHLSDATALSVSVISAATSSVSDSKVRAHSSVSVMMLADKARMPVLSHKKVGAIAAGVSSIHHYGPTTLLSTSSGSSTGTSAAFHLRLRGGLFPICEKESDDNDEDESGGESFRLTGAEIDWSRLTARRVERARRFSFLFRPGEAIDWDNIDLKCVQQDNSKIACAIFENSQAFSHFSWQHILGALMVVDLQGVNYILTDPQVHTRNNHDTNFGVGNLGMDGMAAFFCTHSCNDLCRKMKLQSFNKHQSKSVMKDEVEIGSSVFHMTHLFSFLIFLICLFS